jgi:hypothetical protein
LGFEIFMHSFLCANSLYRRIWTGESQFLNCKATVYSLTIISFLWLLSNTIRDTFLLILWLG